MMEYCLQFYVKCLGAHSEAYITLDMRYPTLGGGILPIFLLCTVLATIL